MSFDPTIDPGTDTTAARATDRPGRGSWFRTAYGAGPQHLLGMLAALALVTYTVSVLGPSALWDPEVWWQSILVWFLGAIIAHDLVLFPLYALADRLTQRGLLNRSASETTSQPWRGVPALNYIRIPAIAVGLLFLLFFPGILQQGAGSYLAATGQTQDPFLERWLLLSAVIVVLSAATYGARVFSASRAKTPSAPPPET